MNIFTEIAITNRAYCQANGLSAGDLYGTPPNADELATSRLIGLGVPAEAAVPVFKVRKAKHLKYWPRTPFQRIGWIEEQIKQGCYQSNGEQP